MAKVILKNGPNAGLEYIIGEKAILGRHVNNEIPLLDNKASRQHTRILRENSEYFVEDMQSRNGTIVNGKKINKQKLSNQDEIKIGETLLIFILDTNDSQVSLEQPQNNFIPIMQPQDSAAVTQFTFPIPTSSNIDSKLEEVLSSSNLTEANISKPNIELNNQSIITPNENQEDIVASLAMQTVAIPQIDRQDIVSIIEDKNKSVVNVENQVTITTPDINTPEPSPLNLASASTNIENKKALTLLKIKKVPPLQKVAKQIALQEQILLKSSKKISTQEEQKNEPAQKFDDSKGNQELPLLQEIVLKENISPINKKEEQTPDIQNIIEISKKENILSIPSLESSPRNTSSNIIQKQKRILTCAKKKKKEGFWNTIPSQYSWLQKIIGILFIIIFIIIIIWSSRWFTLQMLN